MMLAARLLLLLSLLRPGLACASDCAPEFPYRQGWLGGDAAYSIPLSSFSSVWLFGDTFIAAPGQTTRAGARLVANTIGISTCRDERWDIEYAWRGLPGSPQPLFESAIKDIKLWPLDGFVRAGRLYVFLSRVRATRGGGALGFEGIGVTLACVANPRDRPEMWKIRYSTLAEGGVAFPGVSAVVRGDYVYLYTVLDDAAHKDHPMILTRVPLGALDDAAHALEYWAKDGTWKPGLDWRAAGVVLENGATELSVRYHPHEKVWVALQGKPGFGSDEVVIRTAPDLEGPWSGFQTLFRLPELSPTSKDKDAFCYATKEHAEFQRRDGELLLTYVCSSFDFARLKERTELYRPKAVALPLPPQRD